MIKKINQIIEKIRLDLDNRENKHIPTDNLLKLAEFVLKKNYFESDGKVKKQLLGTVIGTKFVQRMLVFSQINLIVIF